MVTRFWRVLGQIMAADTSATHDTAALLNLQQVERAAEAIAGTSRVDIHGASGSALVGSEMQLCLHRIGVAAWPGPTFTVDSPARRCSARATS
ncbi:MAG: hypothetical protein QOI74_111, partial [Micromonosporaceae bacterium]|nr:hypothetical protein [Micromonosporaceae bacterium]